MTVKEYILENINKTTRLNTETEEGSTLIALPKPYTTPSVKDAFQEMYYWDTFFTNKGLILIGNTQQAINNLDNFVYLIEKLGFIPNGNRTYFLNRSQPPVFGMAVADVWDYINDAKKTEYLNALKKEYAFWDTKRKTENGLNRYDCSATDKEYLEFVQVYKDRTGIALPETVLNGRGIMAEAESGWDFSPRFPDNCLNYNPIDLNSLLYFNEIFLSEHDSDNREYWQTKATIRKNKLSSFKNKNGIFCDFCYKSGKIEEVFGTHGFFPYFTGLSKDEKGYELLLSKLEKPFGVIVAKTGKQGFQWAEPNCWAPQEFVAIRSAEMLGLTATAKRLAETYVNAIDNLFKKTGKLFEKIDAETGLLPVNSEYGTPEMLGWTAGVYLESLKRIENS